MAGSKWQRIFVKGFRVSSNYRQTPRPRHGKPVQGRTPWDDLDLPPEEHKNKNTQQLQHQHRRQTMAHHYRFRALRHHCTFRCRGLGRSLSSVLTSGTSPYAVVEVRLAANVYITPIDVHDTCSTADRHHIGANGADRGWSLHRWANVEPSVVQFALITEW